MRVKRDMRMIGGGGTTPSVKVMNQTKLVGAIKQGRRERREETSITSPACPWPSPRNMRGCWTTSPRVRTMPPPNTGTTMPTTTTTMEDNSGGVGGWQQAAASCQWGKEAQDGWPLMTAVHCCEVEEWWQCHNKNEIDHDHVVVNVTYPCFL